MINDLTSPVERGPIIDVSQQDVNVSCASLLTGFIRGMGLVSGGLRLSITVCQICGSVGG